MNDRVQTIFDQICDLPAEQRGTKLTAECAGDADLRARVEELLRAHDEAGDFMAEPTTDMPNPNASKITKKAGDEIDRYKLLEAIGEGGFGVVYMAQQTEPVRRRVAIKIIKLGMDTRQVVARFEAERQALAMMDHPNIARVLDGGATDTGRPYFVMELVRGDPITEYCDREKLSTPARLELFQQVCNAIQHAHQKGIIHRDVKPSNVLVTVADGRPLVKVIDFGIAKATNQELTEKTLFTEFRQLIGTPQYMSPEQAERSGVDVDTRSDIYSLGVLLYEILTGQTPMDPERLRSAQWGELQRMIRDEEPTKPSAMVTSLGANGTDIAKRRSTQVATLGGALKGDLDWIVMRALEKDRTRRYGTASQLADDIGRYLTDQPVEASPPSVSYRMRKFAKRNRRMLTGAGLLLGLLFAGLIGTSAATMWALSEREEAETARAEAVESQELAQTNAERASQSAEKAKRVASMIGLMPGLLREEDVDRLSTAWLQDIDAQKKELGENDKSVVRAECQHANWLFMQGQSDIERMREIHKRARTVLGFDDPSFLSFANAHTVVQSRQKGDDPGLKADLYADVIASLKAIHGDDASEMLMPEYAWALNDADRKDQAVDALHFYVQSKGKQKKPTKPMSTVELMKLDISMNQLSELAVDEPKLFSDLRAIRANQGPTDSTETDGSIVNTDRDKLQGKWISLDDDGTSMQQEFRGDKVLIQWMDTKGKPTRTMDLIFKLRKEGSLSIMDVMAPGSPSPLQTVVYRFDDDVFFSASGFHEGPTKPVFSKWLRPDSKELKDLKKKSTEQVDLSDAKSNVQSSAESKALSNTQSNNQPSNQPKVQPDDATAQEKPFDDARHRWEGTLNTGLQKMRMRIEADRQEDGTYTGNLISVDQLNAKIKLDTFEIDDERLKFTIGSIKASFSGKLNADKNTASGFFTQGLPFPFKLKRVAKFTKLDPATRPQHPKGPFPYDAIEVQFANEKDDAQLAGTLTIPKGDGSFPVAILISGSGPQDRDETLMGHKPFLVIADHLTRQGIAVLRCDDRGVGKSTGDFSVANSRTFAGDVSAAIDFLKKHPRIDAGKIGLIGHSEGGMIGPMVASERDDVAFVVLLAGTGIDGKQIVTTQSRAMLLAEGAPKKIANVQDELIAEALELSDQGDLDDEQLDALVEKYQDRMGGKAVGDRMRDSLKSFRGPWMEFFLKYDPQPALEKTQCPVLALNGEKDMQVLVEPNLAGIKKALTAGGNKDFEVHALPDLNHLFQKCKTGALSEYSKIEQTFAPEALDIMSKWISERVKK